MDKTSYKIAVVGNRDTILPFKLIGFQTFPVKEAQETVNTLRRLAREDFGIIYLTEDMAADIPETLAYYDQLEIPALCSFLPIRGARDWLFRGFMKMSKRL